MTTIFDREYWDGRLRLGLVLSEIERERRKQDEKWGVQNHPDFPDVEGSVNVWLEIPLADTVKALCGANHEAGEDDWATILLEELCEAYEERDPAKLRAELIQVAAVCVAWVEAIDRRENGDAN